MFKSYHLEVLPLESVTMTTFENTVFADVIMSGWTATGPNPMTGVIIRETCEDTRTKTNKEEGQVMT